MTNNLPSSIIDSTLASQRKSLFTDKKKAVLDGLIGYKSELDHLNYSVPVFLKLLHFLTEEPGQYSGMRVYFASQRWSEDDPCSRYIPSGQEENLTLIFVPTTAVGQNGDTIHRDDLDNCFIIAHNRLIRLPRPGQVAPVLDTASNWVKHYRKKLATLSVDGEQVTGNAGFRETNCHWYKIGIFVDSTDKDGQVTPGLISYMEKLVKDPLNPLVAIEPQFACYTDTDTFAPDADVSVPLYYQLTLLFELRQKKAPNPIFAMRHLADDEKRAAIARPAAPVPVSAPAPRGPVVTGAGGGTAVAEAAVAAPLTAAGTSKSNESDTGFPCPPAICGGSLLPAS
jgi:hypothetical protein